MIIAGLITARSGQISLNNWKLLDALECKVVGAVYSPLQPVGIKREKLCTVDICVKK